MIKRLLNWFSGLLQSNVPRPLADVRLEILAEDGAAQTRRFRKAGSRGAARIDGICAIESPEK